MLLILTSNLLEVTPDVWVSQCGDGRIKHGEMLPLGGQAGVGSRVQIAVAE